MATPSEVHTLHRYFVWCNHMRTKFYEILSRGNLQPDVFTDEMILANMFMSYWYGGLHVVVEGWQELKLQDRVIDGLLESPNTQLLRRYRNGVFHFQSNYFDDRFIGFMREGQSAVEWVSELNREFGRYFLAFFENAKQNRPNPPAERRMEPSHKPLADC